MRDLRVTFDDSDFEKLEKIKNLSGLDWREFILEMLKKWKR